MTKFLSDEKARADIAALTQQVANHKSILFSYNDPLSTDGENGDVWLTLSEPGSGYLCNYDASDFAVADGTSIEGWEDKSENNIDLLPLTGAPEFSLDGLNDKPSIDFVFANNDGLTKTDFSLGGTGSAFTYFLVVKLKALSVNTNFFQIGALSTDDAIARKIGLRMSGSSNVIYAHINNDAAITIQAVDVDTNAMLISVRYDGVNHVMYKNGILKSTREYSTAVGAHNQLVLGRSLNTNAPYNLNGYISQFRLYNTALSLSDFERVNTFLMSKWGIE